jgi:hypothetical protein
MVMGQIEIEVCQIAYTEAGSSLNPPALFLHGTTSPRSGKTSLHSSWSSFEIKMGPYLFRNVWKV